MNIPFNVLITGTNKGLGNQLVKLFLRFNQNATIYATSREQEQIAYSRWKSIDKANRVKCKYLDISSTQSINNFANIIEKQKIKIDVLINNAGVSKSDTLRELPSLQWAKQCLQTNIVGQIDLTQKILPFLSDQCKIMNVSSMLAGLKFQPIQTQTKFSNPKITKQDILVAVDQYAKEIQANNLVSFSASVYGTSKMLLGAWSRFIVQQKWLKGKQLSICVSPGLCNTPMTQQMPKQFLAKAFSAQSGAYKMYQTLYQPNLDANIFYHRNRITDFNLCGQQLPMEQ